MGFDALAADSADAIFAELGVSGTLVRGLVSTSVQVIVDKNVQVFPGGWESIVNESRTEVSFLMAEAPVVLAGDQVVVPGAAYIVKSRVFTDGVVHRWEVRNQ